jgi:membrane peptidoglycan carboxypeptidase
MDELSKVTRADGKLQFADAEGDIANGIQNGGLRIITTIDPLAQADAVKAAGGTVKESPMSPYAGGELQAALVSVEPTTGRVRAYYGGPNGAGCDYAANYTDPVLNDGEGSGCSGAHPPGSSFKTYTLATALMNGYSVNSYWNGKSGQKFPGRERLVKNAGEAGGADGRCQSQDPTKCMLWEATEQSLNTPFFAIANMLGPNKVIATANAAGVHSMWATVKVDGKDQAVRRDLNNYKGNDFSSEVGFGQYPITVLDHANGQATLAARGYANTVHFVSEVFQKDQETGKEKKVYGEKIAPKRIPGFTDGISDDLNWTLEKVPVRNKQTLNGWEAAGKTGTWQLGEDNGGNAHAWMVGYTMPDVNKKQLGLATAVWVGNKGDEKAIKLKDGKGLIGSRLPGPIWQYFMNNALKDMKAGKVKFNQPKFVGDKFEGTGTSPEPTVPPVGPGNPPGPNDGQTTPGIPNNPTPTNSGGAGGGVNPRPSRSRF